MPPLPPVAFKVICIFALSILLEASNIAQPPAPPPEARPALPPLPPVKLTIVVMVDVSLEKLPAAAPPPAPLQNSTDVLAAFDAVRFVVTEFGISLENDADVPLGKDAVVSKHAPGAPAFADVSDAL